MGGMNSLQTGSIKRRGHTKLLDDLFQFQTGSIKSGNVDDRTFYLHSFNSKLVRLKALLY